MRKQIFLQAVAVLSLLLGPTLNPAFEADASIQSGSGYWHTSGNQILDSNNNLVKGAGLNWSGFETTNFVVTGLSEQPYRMILDQIAQYGYNTIRIPFSNQVVETNPVPSPDMLTANPDLQGLHSLDILDRLVTYAGQLGLKIILDNHRSDAGTSAQESGLWYTGAYPESAWIADWQMLAARYNGNSTVIGFDLRNEPHTPPDGAAQGPGSDWGSGNIATDWHLAAQRAGNAILAVNPNLLILVEGISRYPNGL
ncbi:MAG: cellulase family glycosylhydrolase [Chloroflexi bacterium]|nr:cellulase family glycosylhydrolase [Chloroflexota bacterium]